MRRKIVLSICILFGCLCMTYGQLMNNLSFNETFRYRVKQMDEFMKRFNGIESIPLPLEDSLKRCTNMLYLFDSELFRNNPDSVKNAVFEFIEAAVEDSTSLHYTDSTWTAEVLCHCHYKNKEEKVTSFLKPEQVEVYVYRWVIVGAKGEILDLEPLKRNHGLDIQPDNHEVGFIDLSKIAAIGNENILNYSEKNYLPDALSVFYALIYSGQLTLAVVEKTKFHLWQVPGYTFTVERVEREGNNTGWLISSFKRIDGNKRDNCSEELYR